MTRFVLQLALTALLCGCDRPRPPRAEEARCPEGDRSDPSREARLRALLGGTAAGAGLLERAPATLRLCFGDRREPGITPVGLVLLDEGTTDGEDAALLGHLLLHLAEGTLDLEQREPGRPCGEVVEVLLDGEARAHALELELRRELGVTSPRRGFPFEQDFWAAPAPGREALVRDYLRAHPSGGAGLPGFADAYRSRCEASRKAGAR